MIKTQNLIIIIIFFFCSTLILFSKEIRLKVDPEFRIDETNYNKQLIIEDHSYMDLFNKFTKSYNYSMILREKIIKKLYLITKKNDFDIDILKRCIELTKEIKFNKISVPFLVRKTYYENNEVLIIYFVWGINSNDFAHYCYYVIDYKKNNILFADSCL
ncbi:MAG: hypothetical protein A2086_01640 [Spirochaetes bacterium GWD1_27_9]|nr:MAG: hypothetical protein A2Z98_04090 [Spirochaetes bacterium GWB1_27_13]OHD20628.1 MAG: hypothetical protein A2Y34_17570 [Spirochaetes bacterium GWC1_27_15]OHD41805.1 MAG: hypothetical protein A2086_01640 [Spirochaetes bacterium GWD1_27_9]